MSKLKASMKDIKNSNIVVVGVSYCAIQRLLNYESPIAYSSGQNGWNCDLYKLDEKYSIVTGYNYSRASNIDSHDIKPLYECLRALENDCSDLSKSQRKQALIEALKTHIN